MNPPSEKELNTGFRKNYINIQLWFRKYPLQVTIIRSICYSIMYTTKIHWWASGNEIFKISIYYIFSQKRANDNNGSIIDKEQSSMLSWIFSIKNNF